MGESDTNAAIDAVQALQHLTMSNKVVEASGAGKAYQSVAQSTAIAIQDATDHLRNMETISSTAIGVALSQLLATGEPKYLLVLAAAQGVMTSAAENFTQIGSNAAVVLSGYPSGSSGG